MGKCCCNLLHDVGSHLFRGCLSKTQVCFHMTRFMGFCLGAPELCGDGATALGIHFITSLVNTEVLNLDQVRGCFCLFCFQIIISLSICTMSKIVQGIVLTPLRKIQIMPIFPVVHKPI